MDFVGVVDEVGLGHGFFDDEILDLFEERFAILEEGIESEAFGEAEFVFFLEFFGLGFGDDLGLVVVLEKGFELGLVEDDDVVVDDGDLVVVGDFEADLSREGLEAFAVEFPRCGALEGGRSGDTLGDVEEFDFAIIRVGEFGDDAFDFFELVFVVGEVGDVFVFVFDEVQESFGAGDAVEFGAVDDFVFTVGLFVFVALEAFVGFFDDVTDGFLHEDGFDGVSEFVGITHFVGGVVFVEQKKFNADVVFDFVDGVGPLKDVKDLVRRS